jgi:hypothetical protein
MKRRRLDTEGFERPCDSEGGGSEIQPESSCPPAGGGEEGEGADADLVSAYLLRQASLRVRMVEDDLDEAAEDREWERRWKRWMEAAEEEGEGGCGATGGVEEILKELGVDSAKEKVSHVTKVPAEAGKPGLDLTWWKCSQSPKVSTRTRSRDPASLTSIATSNPTRMRAATSGFWDERSVLCNTCKVGDCNNRDRNAGVDLPGFSERARVRAHAFYHPM